MKIKENKKRGFTLAEVLITLAIIGVVAALTLPTMIANHQKKVYVVQLQKAISTLEQGFKMMMADDAVDKLQYTSVFELTLDSENGECQSTDYNNDEACTKFFDAWKKYFNISQIATVDSSYKWYFLNNASLYDDYFAKDGYYLLQFADGMFADLAYVSSNYYFSDGYLGLINIDVNGLKGPNTWGRDVFSLFIMPDGTVEGPIEKKKVTKEDCYSSSNDGSNCSSYLMNNGWVMDY